MVRCVMLAALVLALSASLGAADTVHLKNGRRLQGTIERESEREVVILLDGLGSITVGRSEIERIERSAERPAPPPPTPTPSPPTPSPSRSAPAPAPARPAAPASGPIDLGREIELSVAEGLVEEALAFLAQEAGVRIEFTEGARTRFAELKPRTRGYRHRQAVASWMRSLVDHTNGLRLKWVVDGDRIVVGRAQEICGPAPESSGAAVFWRDAEGDSDRMGDPPGWRRPDLTRLEMRGENGFLELQLTFSEDLGRILVQETPTGTRKGYDLIDVHLDVDADETTGRPLSMDESRTGFEHRVSVGTGMELRDSKGNAFRQWGNIETIEGEHRVEGVFATYTLWRNGSSSAVTVNRKDGDSPGDRTRIDGRRIIARIPYADLDVRAGSKIRVCFSDGLEPLLSDHRISRDALLTLR